MRGKKALISEYQWLMEIKIINLLAEFKDTLKIIK